MPNGCSAAPVIEYSPAAISTRRNRSYGIFRQGKVYTDPQSKEFLGINADDIGGGEIIATEGDVATLALQRTTQEVRLGDRCSAAKSARSIRPSCPVRRQPKSTA